MWDDDYINEYYDEYWYDDYPAEGTAPPEESTGPDWNDGGDNFDESGNAYNDDVVQLGAFEVFSGDEPADDYSGGAADNFWTVIGGDNWIPEEELGAWDNQIYDEDFAIIKTEPAKEDPKKTDPAKKTGGTTAGNKTTGGTGGGSGGGPSSGAGAGGASTPKPATDAIESLLKSIFGTPAVKTTTTGPKTTTNGGPAAPTAANHPVAPLAIGAALIGLAVFLSR